LDPIAGKALHGYPKRSLARTKEPATAIIILVRLSTRDPEYLDITLLDAYRGRTIENLLYQMPITGSFPPQRQQDLTEKVRANVPGQEAQLLEDVKSHVSAGLRYRRTFANNKQLEQQGSAVYRQSPNGVTDVTLTAEKCIVFPIKGKFRVDGRNDYKQGEAHVVEKEQKIRLEKGAVVIIIDAV